MLTLIISMSTQSSTDSRHNHTPEKTLSDSLSLSVLTAKLRLQSKFSECAFSHSGLQAWNDLSVQRVRLWSCGTSRNSWKRFSLTLDSANYSLMLNFSHFICRFFYNFIHPCYVVVASFYCSKCNRNRWWRWVGQHSDVQIAQNIKTPLQILH